MNVGRLGHRYLSVPQHLWENILLTFVLAGIEGRLGGGFAGSPSFQGLIKRDPVVLAAMVWARRVASRSGLKRVAGRSCNVVGEAHEERAQDRNGAEDDYEPHFRQHPYVQRPDGVGNV